MRRIPRRRPRPISAALTVMAFLTLLAAERLMAQEVPGGEALAGPFHLMVAVFIVAYVYIALALQTIARKTNTANGWWAWIPILQIVLSLNVARKPLWWVVLCLIPFLGIVMMLLIWMGIAKARNRPGWWGVLLIVPVVNLIIVGMLAWSDKTPGSSSGAPANGLVVG
jgi:uncharacterized membrane protein YhaH (DUF805 family)